MASALAWVTALDARLPPQLRRSWRWLAASLTVFWLGDAVFLAEKIALARRRSSAASPADALYLASYPLAAMALLAAGGWRPERRGARGLLARRLASSTLGGATLAWHVFVQPTLAGQRKAEELTAVAYVLCDVALLLLLAIRAGWAAAGYRAGILLLGAALLARLCANALYWYGVLLARRVGSAAAPRSPTTWPGCPSRSRPGCRCATRGAGAAAPGSPPSSLRGPWLPTLAAAVGYLVLAGSVVRRSASSSASWCSRASA